MTKPQADLIPKSAAERLQSHEAAIHTFIAGQRKSSAETFGYAFLAGHRMLLAKADVPHGNSGGANAGLKNWVEERFKEISYRTAQNWMVFAEGVSAHLSGKQFKKLPLLLSRKKINAADRPVILKAVLEVMDGKGMLAFMRDSRLLRDPETAKHHPRKNETPDQALAAAKKQALRHWKTITGDLVLGLPAIKHLAPEQARAAAVQCLSAVNKLAPVLSPKEQDELLGCLVDASNAIRERSKKKG